MERKRPSSSKSPKKRRFSKKNYEGSTIKTRSRTGNNSPSYSPNNSDLCDSGSSSNLLDPGAIADDKRSMKVPSSTSYFPSSSDLSYSGSSDDSDSAAIDDDKKLKKAPSSSYIPNNLDLSDSGSSNLLDTCAIADDKRSKKEPCSPPNSTDLPESESYFPFPNLSQISKGDERHKKDGTKDVRDGSARNTLKKIDPVNTEFKKFKVMQAEREAIKKRKELKRSKLGDVVETSKTAPNASSNENVTDLKSLPTTDTKKGVSKRPLGHSEVYEKHETSGTEQVENASGQNKTIEINKGMSSEDSKKARASLTNQVENKEELKRSKIDDWKAAGKKHDDGSNENIADMKFSPVTAVGKAVSKRLSDPNNALKENRPRTSL